MRFYKYTALIFVLLAVFSCRKTNLTITEPGPDFFLGKMKNGNWTGVKVDGDKLTINGKNYTFENPILGVGGVYNDGKGGYLLTVPFGDSLGTVEATEEGKKAINEILDIIGEENALAAVNGVIDIKDPNNINVDEIVRNVDVTEEDKKKIEDIINRINGKNHFKNPEKYS
ncbi:hypothetical protein [uncultured Brachyspira sp.]|uniref:hypothetical protein n=1 Tax=uncultured Brachyspira sp. TaxID=221953 RepID=UPI0025E38590|nr:hypothetical protein [uncultured Brachyspira sp.]